MIPEALPGKSVVLYRVFAEAEGRWATPTWIMGCSTGKPFNGVYKPLALDVKALNMVTI